MCIKVPNIDFFVEQGNTCSTSERPSIIQSLVFNIAILSFTVIMVMESGDKRRLKQNIKMLLE